MSVRFEMMELFEERCPNNNKKNKMSSDVGSVPDPTSLLILFLEVSGRVEVGRKENLGAAAVAVLG